MKIKIIHYKFSNTFIYLESIFGIQIQIQILDKYENFW